MYLMNAMRYIVLFLNWRREMRFYKLIFVFVFIFSLSSYSQNYNEVYDQNGNVRPAYKGVIEIYESLTPAQKRSFKKQSLRDFSKDNSLLPIPRIFTQSEYDLLVRGVKQRGKAIQRFLKDHYSGRKNYLKDNILPPTIIERIINRNHEQEWQDYLKASHISFWYGPDVVRADDGKFYVLEDNPGFVGGFGDLNTAKNSLEKQIPAYKDLVNSPDPNKFYQNMINDYKKRADKFGGIPVIVMYTKSMAADNEETRIQRLFEEHGIEVVKVSPTKKLDKKLVSTDSGVWLEKSVKSKNGNTIKRRRKVGFIVTNLEVIDLDSNHPGYKRLKLMQEAELTLDQKDLSKKEKENLKRLMRPDERTGEVDYFRLELQLRHKSKYLSEIDDNIGFEGLLEHYIDGRVGLSTSPGLEFIGDKEFYIYVDKLVRYYLGEEPILKNVKSGSFAKYDPKTQKFSVDKKMFDYTSKNKDKFVFKGVGGRGGDAVWVGPKTSASELQKVKKMILENPENFKYQQYLDISILEDHIVDTRVLSDVGPSKVIVSDVSWGRAVQLKGGDGKVNIGSNGSETTVYVRKESKSCLSTLNKVLSK